MNYLFSTLSSGWYWRDPSETIPLGLASVAAALRATGRCVSGIHVDWHEDPLKALLQRIEYEEIDVLCMGALSKEFITLRETISAVRKNYPHIKIIVGGYIITSQPEFIVNHLDIDFGCIGYGEETICEFAECLESNGDFSKIKGLIYKDETGKFIINPMRPQPKCLDDLPFPALELFGFSGGNQLLPIELSRECVGGCTFCYRTPGHKYVSKSINRFFLELDYWVKMFAVTKIEIRDELFCRNKKITLEICRRIKVYNIKYLIFLKPDFISDEIMQAFAESGCFAIFIGIESMCQRVLSSMRKNLTTEQIENALRIARKYSVHITGHIIFGDTVETYNMAKESLDWRLKNLHYDVYLNLISAHPNSAIYKHGIETGRIKDKLHFLESGCAPINLSAMSDIEYSKLHSQIQIINNLSVSTAKNIRFKCNEDNSLLMLGDCIHCETVNAIDSKSLNFSYLIHFDTICNECNTHLKFVFKEAGNYLDSRYFNEFNYEGKKLVVWGLSEKAKFRLFMNDGMRNALVAIVDRDYSIYQNKFMAFDVQSPKILSKTEFDVLYIGSSVARESILSMAREIVGSELYKKEVMIMP